MLLGGGGRGKSDGSKAAAEATGLEVPESPEYLTRTHARTTTLPAAMEKRVVQSLIEFSLRFGIDKVQNTCSDLSHALRLHPQIAKRADDLFYDLITIHHLIQIFEINVRRVSTKRARDEVAVMLYCFRITSFSAKKRWVTFLTSFSALFKRLFLSKLNTKVLTNQNYLRRVSRFCLSC